MRPVLYVLSFLAVLALGFWAYRENYATQAAQREVEALQDQIAGIRESLTIQRAEWAYLNRPDRLRDLATINFDRLGLLPMEPEQFADEVGRLQGLWPSLDTHLGAAQQSLRPPARALSHWHLALALAAGAISGVVRSKTGRVLVVKGDTHKDKTLQREFTEREDGSIAETRILTDKFVPVIRAWDMTPGSPTRGEVLTIR